MGVHETEQHDIVGPFSAEVLAVLIQTLCAPYNTHPADHGSNSFTTTISTPHIYIYIYYVPRVLRTTMLTSADKGNVLKFSFFLGVVRWLVP